MQFTNFALVALSLGSAFAGPVVHQESPRDLQIQLLGSADQSIKDANTNVQSQASNITSLISTNATATIVPKVEKALWSITGEVTTLLNKVVPDLTETVFDLLQGDLTGLGELLSDVLDLVKGIVSALTELVGGLAEDLFDSLLPEVQMLIHSLKPFVKPIASLVTQTIGGLATPLAKSMDGQVTELNKLVESVMEIGQS